MPSIAKLIRYTGVSAISTVTGLTVLGVLVGVFTFPAGWSNVIATAVGTFPSFELNRRWVWKRDGMPSLRRQVVPFCALSFVTLGWSTLAVHLGASWADAHHLHRVARTLVVEAANVAAFGSAWVAQFVLCERVLFRTRQATAPGGPMSLDARGAGIDVQDTLVGR